MGEFAGRGVGAMSSRGVVSMRKFRKEVCNSAPFRVEELVSGIGEA
jgi:hypothetical protein